MIEDFFDSLVFRFDFSFGQFQIRVFDQNAPLHPAQLCRYRARNGLLPTSDADYGFLQALGALDIAACSGSTASIQPPHLMMIYHCHCNQQGTDGMPLGYRRPRSHRGAKASNPVTIDLRNATLGDDSFAGGYVSRVDGIKGGSFP